MDNLKIRVNNEAESKEAQELFFKLAAKKVLPNSVCFSKDVRAVCCINNIVWVNTISFESCDDKLKEITLPELRDMVVLKRNDANDANVYQDGEVACLYDLYLTSSNDLYFFHIGKNSWVQSNLSGDNYYYKLLKPIEKQMKEYLDPQQAESLPFVDDEKTGIEATLNERQAAYGSFEDVADITQRLLKTLKDGNSFEDLTAAQVESLHMICSKMARIVNGNPDHKDSWHDIAGYAKLIEDLI